MQKTKIQPYDAWMFNENGEHVIIDLGYFHEPGIEERHKALNQLVSKRNFLSYSNRWYHRLMVYVPPTKVETVLAGIPQIKAKSDCWHTTHSWVAPDREAAFDLGQHYKPGHQCGEYCNTEALKARLADWAPGPQGQQPAAGGQGE